MRTTLAVVVVALLLAAGSGAATHPQVLLVRASPVTLVGSGYAAHAHVVVRYRSGGSTAQRAVVASTAGRFRLVFAGSSFSRCAGLSVTAGAARLHVGTCAAGGAPRLTADPGGHVAGRAFVPGERVVVSARPSGGETVTRAVTASMRGTFAARVALPAHACAEVAYRATGSLGSTATYVAPAPDCMAP